MIGYKLVDENGYTRWGNIGETLWKVGETVHPTGDGDEECGPGVLHYYATDLLAVLLNPIHASIDNPRLFTISHGGPHYTDGLKCWTTSPCVVLAELELLELSTEQLVHWTILCAQTSSQSAEWERWAKEWLLNRDRSEAAAGAAAEGAASVAAWVAALSAEAAEEEAARAAWEAWAVEDAAWVAAARIAAEAAALSTEWAAAEAAWEAWGAARKTDFAALAERMWCETN